MGFGQPLASSCRYETLGAGTGIGTTVTAGSTANTKGAYATLGTTSFQYDGIFLDIHKEGTSTGRGLIDIAVNTGGSDQVVVANLMFCCTGGSIQGSVVGLWIPVAIPAGATVKARWQSATASSLCFVMLSGYAGDSRQSSGFRGAIALTDFTNSDPTNTLALSGTTQTGWVQLAASSAARVTGVFATLSDLGTALSTAAAAIIDIGWGAAGSERVLRRWSVVLATAAPTHLHLPVSPCDFPAGTRFAARAQCNAADTNTIGVALYGLAA